MNRKIIVMLSLLLLTACRGATATPAPYIPTRIPVGVPTSLPITPLPEKVTARVADLLEQMTLAEKIGQMTQVEKDSIKPGDISRYFIGSIISGGGGSPIPNTVENWAAMVDGFQREALATRLGIPLIYSLDAVHGFGPLYGATLFPHNIGLGATRNPELVQAIGQATAEEMLAVGVRWNFSPVIAAAQDIRWGRTYESFSEDTDLVTELGLAAMLGLQQLPATIDPATGQEIYVLGTPKHFLGDGGTTFGTSTQEIFKPYLLDQGDMRYDEASIRSLFLPPYQQAVRNGAMSIMVSFSSWNGVKMHAQEYWITNVLKGEMGFQGFVVSDWGGMDQISSDYYEAIVTGINAGIDMNMVPYNYTWFIETMTEAVEKGDISQERIDDAVRRILTAKVLLGLFERPYSDPDLFETIGSVDHRQLARQAVAESLVLLKNETDLLPLKKDTALIYVAGQGAQDIGMQSGGWTTQWQGEVGAIQPGTTILEGIQAAVAPQTQVVYDRKGEFTATAEVGIAVVGEQPYAEGVGDARILNLSEVDVQTITNLRAHSQKLVVIILSGRPLVISNQLPLAEAWVAAWWPGTEGGGVADGLFGNRPFTGKTPFTWPRKHSQLPININNSSALNGCDAPLFPYGYGLGEAGSEPIEWLDCP